MRSDGNNSLVSVVIPAYNEEPSLRELVTGTDRAFSGTSYPYEYVFVDDGSTDKTFQTLAALRKNSNIPMTVVRLRRRSGKSAALAEGFARASGDVVMTLDADLQDDPDEAIRLLRFLGPGADMVVGWRKERRDSRGKLGVSRFFNGAVGFLTGLRLHDMNSGLKVMTRQTAKEIRLYGQLHRFVPVLAHARGFAVVEKPVRHHPRKYGTSKFGISRMFAAFDLLTTLFVGGYGSRPLMVFGPPGILLLGAGSVAILYLTVLHFLGYAIGTRPLLLIGVLMVIFGLQLLSTGLLGELIASSHTEETRASVRDVLGPDPATGR